MRRHEVLETLTARRRRGAGALLSALVLAVGLTAGAPGASAQQRASAPPAVTPVPAPERPGTYEAIAPVRLADSRISDGAFARDEVREFDLGAVLGSDGASAVVLNLTAVEPGAPGHLTAWSGSRRPNVSNLNFGSRWATAAATTVPLVNATLQVANASVGRTHVVIDVIGFYRAGTSVDAGTFQSVDPFRLLDTRTVRGKVSPGLYSGVRVIGAGGVPEWGVSAALLTVTVVDPTAAGHLSVWSDDSNEPPTSSVLNFETGETVANSALVPLGPDGVVRVRNASTGTSHVIVDVVGYYLVGDPNGEKPAVGGALVGVTPTRIADTRTGLGGVARLHAERVGRFVPADVPGRPAHAGSVVLNVTAVAPGAAGHLSVYSDTPTGTSSVNFPAGRNVANLVVARLAGDGSFSVVNRSSAGVDLVIDVVGFLISEPAPTMVRSGMVYAWGGDQFGQRGDGPERECWQHCLHPSVPRLIPGLADVVAMAGTAASQYALKSDGTVWAWGLNTEGQLGDGTYVTRESPVAVRGLTDVVSIAATDGTAYAIKRNGTVWSWGHNGPLEGSLGIDSGIRNSNVPVQIPGFADAVQVGVGKGPQIFVRRANGTVWGWGFGMGYSLGLGVQFDIRTVPQQLPGLERIVDVAAGPYKLALRDDGTLWSWGSAWREPGFRYFQAPTAVQVPAPQGKIVDLESRGMTAAYALMADGRIYSWGANPGGVLGTGDTEAVIDRYSLVRGITTAVGVSAGGMAGYATLADGTAMSWGDSAANQLGAGNVDVGVGPTRILVPVPVSAVHGSSGNGYAIVR